MASGYIGALAQQRRQPDAIGSALIGLGGLAGGLAQMGQDNDDRQRKIEEHLRGIAAKRLEYVQKKGAAADANGDARGLARYANMVIGLEKEAGLGDGLGAPIVGAPRFEQQRPLPGLGTSPDQLAGLTSGLGTPPPSPFGLNPNRGLASGMPSLSPAPSETLPVEIGRDFSNPQSLGASRGLLGLEPPTPTYFELGAGQQRYSQLPGQAPKLVASLDPRPATKAAPKYVQSTDAAGNPVWVEAAPGIPAYVKPEKGDKDTSMKEYNKAYAEWQQRGASYVNDYVSLMARNSQRTRVQNGVTMTVPPTPEQMKAWREEGQAQWRAQVNPPPPPGGSSSTYPFGNPNPPSSGKAGGGTARWASQISAASKATGVPAEIITAVMRQESGGQPGVVSGAGAIGLMQFMPGTARAYGIDPRDPEQAILAGAEHLKGLYAKFGKWSDAIAAYNAGADDTPAVYDKRGKLVKRIGPFARSGDDPKYRVWENPSNSGYAETRNYVKSIKADLKRQGIEISAAEAEQVAGLYEKYGITPGAANA